MASPNQMFLEKSDGCFVSRPRPAQGELFDAYICRVLRANGFESIRGLVEGSPYSMDVKKEFLLRRLILPDEEMEKLVAPGDFIVKRQEDRKLFLTSRVRWCPRCVAENPVLLGRWLYRTTVVCSAHRLFMQDECPYCHAPQKIQSIPGQCCTCGATLLMPADAEVSDPLFQVQTWLDESATDGQAHPSLFNLPYHQAAKLMHYLGVVACSTVRGALQETASSRRVLNDRVLMNAAASVVVQWPNSFITLLALRQVMPMTNSVRDDFGCVYTVLYRSLKSAEYQFLRDVFENYVNNHWAGILTRRNKAFSERTRRSHPRMTVKQAARTTEVAPALLKRMSGALKGSEVVSPKGRRSLTVGTNLLNRVQGSTLAQAAKFLRLPRRRVRMLIENGILQAEISPVVYRAAAWFISRDRLDGLLITRLGRSQQLGVPLYRILRYGKLNESEFIKLTEALISGAMGIVNDALGPVPLGLAEVTRADLKHWLSALRARDSRSLSVDEAAKSLGVKQQVAYQLVRNGLLCSYRDPDHRTARVRYSDLENFERQYVSLVELARNRQTSPKALLANMPCRPVTGPTVDGGRQYFYRQADLSLPE